MGQIEGPIPTVDETDNCRNEVCEWVKADKGMAKTFEQALLQLPTETVYHCDINFIS